MGNASFVGSIECTTPRAGALGPPRCLPRGVPTAGGRGLPRPSTSKNRQSSSVWPSGATSFLVNSAQLLRACEDRKNEFRAPFLLSCSPGRS